MKLTRVEAGSMQEAIRKVRTAIGEDAMIVGTRTFRRGGILGVGSREVVEVYVAENKSRVQEPSKDRLSRLQGAISKAVESARQQGGQEGLVEDPRLAPDVKALSQALGTLRAEVKHLAAHRKKTSFDHPLLNDAFELLVSNGVDEKLAERLVWELKRVQLPLGVTDPDRVRALVKAQVRKLFLPNVPTATKQDGKVQILVGATGVGKTTTAAKLAARAKINEKKQVGLVTLDTFRIAAVDQLQKYAKIIGLTLHVVSDPIEFRSSVNKLRKEGMDLILVDTAGRGQRDELKMGELHEFLSVLPDAEVHLVLSTTTEGRTFRKVADRFVPLGVQRLILTKIDETECFGSLLPALVAIGKPVSYLTDGQNVPEDIMPSDPDRLTDLVFRVAEF